MCQSCEALMINGIYCHEHGCSDAWKDYAVECRWCGCEFRPEHRDQCFCSSDCEVNYYGF